jgi:alkylhydroperoxidase family enzyme
MALIDYPDPSRLSDGALTILKKYPNNLVRMLMGLGEPVLPFMETIGACANSAAISPRLRELITLRVAFRLEGNYVVHQHQSIARQIGMSPDEIEAAYGILPSHNLSNIENQVLLLIDELLFGKASVSMLISVKNLIGDEGLQQAFLVFSLFRFLVIFSASLQIEIDEPISV